MENVLSSETKKKFSFQEVKDMLSNLDGVLDVADRIVNNLIGVNIFDLNDSGDINELVQNISKEVYRFKSERQEVDEAS